MNATRKVARSVTARGRSVTVSVLLIVVSTLALLVGISALWLGSLYVVIRKGWPLWWHDVGCNAFWSLVNVVNALRALVDGSSWLAAFFAAFAGFAAWCAYDVWRRNRRKRKRRESRSSSRVALVAGRLRVVPVRPPS